MKERHHILTGLVMEFEEVPSRVLDKLVYEVDQRVINIHGYRMTEVQYTREYGGPSSKLIKDAIDELLNKDVLRKTDDKRYKIDYYSKSEEIYSNIQSESEEAIRVVSKEHKDSTEKEILTHINNYNKVELTQKYGLINIDESSQATL